jgi:hypothetical protein
LFHLFCLFASVLCVVLCSIYTPLQAKFAFIFPRCMEEKKMRIWPEFPRYTQQSEKEKKNHKAQCVNTTERQKKKKSKKELFHPDSPCHILSLYTINHEEEKKPSQSLLASPIISCHFPPRYAPRIARPALETRAMPLLENAKVPPNLLFER